MTARARPARRTPGSVAVLAVLALLLAGCAAPQRPVVESVTVEPAAPDTNATANARAVVHDPAGAGATLTYQWLRNGEEIPGATAASLDLSRDGSGDRGESIAVRVVAVTEDARSEPGTSAAVEVMPAVTIEVPESRTFYLMEGADSETLFASIEENGPSAGRISASGRTDFRVERSVTTSRIGDSCALDSVTVANSTVLTLPEVVPEPRSADLARKVERFRQAVVEHEEVHARIRREHLEALVPTLRAIPAAPTCGDIERAVADALSEALEVEGIAQEQFHDEDEARIRASCAPLEAELRDLDATLDTLRGEPQRYNALVPAYNALVDDLNWCIKS